jgi:hypothetical protein
MRPGIICDRKTEPDVSLNPLSNSVKKHFETPQIAWFEKPRPPGRNTPRGQTGAPVAASVDRENQDVKHYPLKSAFFLNEWFIGLYE